MSRLLVASLALCLFARPAFADPPLTGRTPAVCVCAEARAAHGWCEVCGRGYLAGVMVPSRALYDVLDPHGHEVDVTLMSCPACRAAWESDGYCGKDRIGFAGGRAYVSRLSWLLAVGRRGDDPEVGAETARLRGALRYLERCELCAVAAFMDGRCPLCKITYSAGRPVTAAPADAAVPASTAR